MKHIQYIYRKENINIGGSCIMGNVFMLHGSFQISSFILSVPDWQKTTKAFEFVEDPSPKAEIASPIRCITFNIEKLN